MRTSSYVGRRLISGHWWSSGGVGLEIAGVERDTAVSWCPAGFFGASKELFDFGDRILEALDAAGERRLAGGEC